MKSRAEQTEVMDQTGSGRGDGPEGVVMTGPKFDGQRAAAAERLGERLQAELGALVRSFPVECRTISGMSRRLGVTRPICQRVMQSVRCREGGLAALACLPGVQGLGGFVSASGATGAPVQLVRAAEAAAVMYADLIDQFGGSQAKLVSAIECADLVTAHTREPVDGEDPSVRTRRQGFEVARAITGREFAVHSGVFIYRPCPDDGSKIDGVTALSLAGVRRDKASMPICPVSTTAFGSPEQAIRREGFEPLELDDGPVGLVEPFCSKPKPKFVVRRTGGWVPVLLDPDWRSRDPIDLVLRRDVRGVPHPALDEPRVQFCTLHSDGPSRVLMLTVHLHRSLARECVATAGAYCRGGVGEPKLGADGAVKISMLEDRWHDRLPDRPVVEYLGLGLEAAESEDYPALPDLTGHLFRESGWSEQEFIGYRIRVEYPVWNAQYVLSFNFEPDA